MRKKLKGFAMAYRTTKLFKLQDAGRVTDRKGASFDVNTGRGTVFPPPHCTLSRDPQPTTKDKDAIGGNNTHQS